MTQLLKFRWVVSAMALLVASITANHFGIAEDYTIGLADIGNAVESVTDQIADLAGVISFGDWIKG